MAKLGTILLLGTSGTVYEFGEYSLDASWGGNVACVYYVSTRTEKPGGSAVHKPIYIGETEDLGVRNADHHKQDCFKKHAYNCISVHLEPSAAARLEIAEDLVTALNPPCND